LGAGDEIGPEGVPLHVTQHQQQVHVALHREVPEASLIEMAGAGGVVVGVPAFCVGVGQPGDELADLLVGARAEDEVP